MWKFEAFKERNKDNVNKKNKDSKETNILLLQKENEVKDVMKPLSLEFLALQSEIFQSNFNNNSSSLIQWWPILIQQTETPPPQNNSTKQTPTTNKEKDDENLITNISSILNRGIESIKGTFESLSDILKKAFNLAKNYVNLDKVPEKISTTIAQMLQYGQTLIGTRYKMWWSNKNWLDCSWLVSSLLNKVWLLKGRKDSYSFYREAQQIRLSQVRAWDFMFRGNNWWGHIEITVGTPYKGKDNKWKDCRYVDTIGSSSDRGIYTTEGNYKGQAGVWYRRRKIQPRHQFRRPLYYKNFKA